MKIGVIGCGTIGGALVNWLRSAGHEVACQDPGKGLRDPLRNIKAAFLCLPAATNDNRTQDLTAIDGWVEHLAYHCIPIFVRSTVLPGTCDRLAHENTADVYAMPEFLTARYAASDFERHPIVCGGKNSGNDALPGLLQEIFQGKELRLMSNLEAEIAKYSHNCFGALKVNYFNVIAELCLKMRANYPKVMEAARITGFIEPEHTRVPGPDGKHGFGGHCLPKDLRAFVGLLQAQGVIGASTLESVEQDNAYYRAKGQSAQEENNSWKENTSDISISSPASV